ncbi:hypothetical protein ERO13_A05G326801v2 [Gossypium hirsutum]|nr:hypothetical protein ERO13_A05G326801v2 [Gossypium hirsutum]
MLMTSNYHNQFFHPLQEHFSNGLEYQKDRW